MSRKLIAQQDVIKVAEELVLADCNPTVAAIRAKLNNGSATTIYKYLQQWKQQCFKKNISEPLTQNEIKTNCRESAASYEFLEEKRNLEQELNKQIVKNENYAQELITAEKVNIVLKEKINQLQVSNQELQLRLTKSEATNLALEQVTQEIQHRLELNDDNTILQQQQLIESLQAELKELNAKSMKAMQELSSSNHEILMQEKVTNINLQAKNEQLMKDLMESQKQLEAMKLQAEFQLKVLQRQIKAQRQVLTNHLTSEELKHLSMEDMLTGVGYGK